MRRTASEVLRNLEMRIARLEKHSAKDFEVEYPNYTLPKSLARKIPSMDAFDVSDLLKERVRFIGSNVLYNLSDVFHRDELNAILNHKSYEIIKKLSVSRNLTDDLLNALA
jgi:hypothetical protein